MPKALSPDAMRALVSKLDEEQTAALTSLIQLLNNSVSDSSMSSGSIKASAFTVIKGWFEGFDESVVSHIQRVPEMIAGIGRGLASIFDGRDISGSVIFLALLVLVIAAGIAAERLFNRGAAHWRDLIQKTKPATLSEALKTLSLRAVVELGGVIAFAVAALVATRLLYSDPADEFLVSSFVLRAILIVRVAGAVLHFVLAPHRADLRLASTDDWTARFVYKNLVLLAGVAGVGLFLVSVMQREEILVTGTLRFWVSLFIHAWIIFMTWKARRGLAAIIKGEEENLTTGLERMAAWWPAISMVIVAFNWFLIQFVSSTGYQGLTPARGALALALIVMAPFLDTMVRGISAHLVPPMEGEGPIAEEAHRETRFCYVRMGRVILVAFLIVMIGKLWGVSLHDLAKAGLGAKIAANAVAFLLVLAIGYMAWEATNLWINRRLAREIPEGGAEQEGGEPGGAGQSRMATVLPILRITLQFTIVIIAALLALSHLGVNITPLLAGAGVLGLAIGFGSQTLVKDVVSGVFFLLDDAFRRGEYIDIGGTDGTVEKISVRSLQLRSARGPVHIVPYGSISKLTNMSRDWVIMKLKFTVPFDTDLDKVRKIFKKIGQELQEVPEYAEQLLSPFKSQGAADVTDVGIVVRGKFTTKPGGQFAIRKEVYSRVQKAFEENGIAFARKEVWVQMSGQEEGTNLTADQKKAIAAAASQAAEPTT